MEKFVCSHPWTHFEVNNPNGNVTMCCNNNAVLGNVNERSILEIWNDDRFQGIRTRMINEGAHAICPDTCPVLNGYKNFERMDWFNDMGEGSEARKNAELNEKEFEARARVLDSKPRWMRFAYSYACNLDCYHCYQREDAVQNTKLPESFLAQVNDLSKTYQIVYYFGGEPFLYKPVLKMMGEIDTDPDCRFHYITNATLLTGQAYEILKSVKIGHFAVSLDAASEETFDLLRRRGANTSWSQVLDNVQKIADLKKERGFSFTISMTVNSANYHEIDDFVELGLRFGAEPLVLLVANPYQTYTFQKDYLQFTNAQFEEMFQQIDTAEVKVRENQFREAESALISLRRTLQNHQALENKPGVFALLTFLRFLYGHLPAGWQQPLRRYIYLPARALFGVPLKSE